MAGFHVLAEAVPVMAGLLKAVTASMTSLNWAGSRSSRRCLRRHESQLLADGAVTLEPAECRAVDCGQAELVSDQVARAVVCRRGRVRRHAEGVSTGLLIEWLGSQQAVLPHGHRAKAAVARPEAAVHLAGHVPRWRASLRGGAWTHCALTMCTMRL